MKKTTSNTISLWLVCILIDVSIAFGISECWVRNFIPLTNITWFIDNKIGTRYRPNQKVYGYVEEGYKNIFVTNSFGFHDVERTKTKDDGTLRIHFYGDSMTVGKCVKTEETIPSLVETYLDSYHFPVKFEVLNMAAGTNSTTGEILTYEKIGAEFDADLVICYFMDDFGDNVLELAGTKHASYHTIGENNELVYHYPPILRDTPGLLSEFKTKRWSSLCGLIAHKIVHTKIWHHYKILRRKFSYYAKDLLNENPNHKAYEERIKEIYIKESWPLTLRLIEYFRDIVEQTGAQFILIDGRTFDENVGTIYKNKDLEDHCNRKGINYIQAYKIMEQLKLSDDLKEYFFLDGHLNQLGNEKISAFLAEEIKDFLVNSGAIANTKGIAFSESKK